VEVVFLLQVKLFDEEHELDLEEAINQFLAEEKPAVHSIHYQVATAPDGDGDGTVFCFSAMIVYDRKETRSQRKKPS
jgi:hypothetical protein